MRKITGKLKLIKEVKMRLGFGVWLKLAMAIAFGILIADGIKLIVAAVSFGVMLLMGGSSGEYKF
jgi:hypothetical protein